MKNLAKPLCLFVCFSIVLVLNAQKIDFKHSDIIPASFKGSVDFCGYGNIDWVKVSVFNSGQVWTTYTDDNNNYYLNVVPGICNLLFSKAGYDDVYVYNKEICAGQIVTIDTCLGLTPDPPQYVTAILNDDYSECLVKWGLPSGPYLMRYDDGTAENFMVWTDSHSENAVKFTPGGYPCVVTGAYYYIGYNFPEGGSVIGSDFGAVVYDDNGPEGMPGSVLD